MKAVDFHGMADPSKILSIIEPMTNVIGAFKAFGERQPGSMKVEIKP